MDISISQNKWGDNFDIYSFCSMNCNYKIFSFLQRNYFISD
ncbi:hypothetical protein BOVA172_4810 [Bacteroides ovatus]|nr:hypothetical protein BOVA435_1942 [Bacteroides ovatus]CAG9920164.1 hypothetical protein BOVAC16_3077 [Bacteroides ovatus]CAG9922085.1 hypothetical protein BOVA172_4810 [Bacteroides ovatus]CAG9930889.1 hypothetical protein BOVA208_5143 [Bacteroides ovatus]